MTNRKAADDNLTMDAFLGGRVVAWQPKRGFRSGIDTVLLAAATDACPGHSVLELGCGSGIASLCLYARIGDLHASGLDLCPDYAKLAQRNAQLNGFDLDIHVGNVADPPGLLKGRKFDRIFANPPYQKIDSGTRSPISERNIARRESVPLAAWVTLATELMAPTGALTMIFPPDRLTEFRQAVYGRADSIRVLPLHTAAGTSCRRMIVRASRAEAQFILADPLILHESCSRNFRPDIEAALRHGKAITV